MKNVNNRQNGDHPSLHIRKSHTKCDFSYLIFIYNMIQYILCIHIMCKTGTTLSVYIYIFFSSSIYRHTEAHTSLHDSSWNISASQHTQQQQKKKKNSGCLTGWMAWLYGSGGHAHRRGAQPTYNKYYTQNIMCVAGVLCENVCIHIILVTNINRCYCMHIAHQCLDCCDCRSVEFKRFNVMSKYTVPLGTLINHKIRTE